MKLGLKLAGLAFALGGVLFFGRMAPIFAVLPEDMSFPPSTTEEMVRLAVISGGRWQFSHILGLIGAASFIAGYWGHARALSNPDRNLIGLTAASVATLGFGLFGVALVIDGFIVPATALAYADGGAGAPSLAAVDAAHAHALTYFTPGVFLIFPAVGLLASQLLFGRIHSRWLGFLGLVIAIAGPSAYFTGAAGENWSNLRIGGSLMMLAFLWHVLTGFAAMFGRGIRKAS